MIQMLDDWWHTRLGVKRHLLQVAGQDWDGGPSYAGGSIVGSAPCTSGSYDREGARWE